MATFLPDSSCIVAAMSEWHPHHPPAEAELRRRWDRGDGMVLAAPALMEAYSVLTRFPEPRRLSPRLAMSMLRGSFIDDTRVIALDSSAYVSLLDDLAAQGVAGGAVYDAVIAECARQGGADTLLTFNDRHFARFAGRDLEVIVPAER